MPSYRYFNNDVKPDSVLDTTIKNKIDEVKFEQEFEIHNKISSKSTVDNMFKKPQSNSSISIKRLETKNFDFKEMLKLNSTDFMSKLSSELNKAKDKNEDSKTIANTLNITQDTMETKELNIEIDKNKNKDRSDISIVSSVESFNQFNRKLAQTTHQTSSPLPNIPSFFKEFNIKKKKNEQEPKKIETPILKTANIIKTTTTTTNDLNKYAKSFDLFDGVSSITQSLNILQKKIGVPTCIQHSDDKNMQTIISQESSSLVKQIIHEVLFI